MHAVPRILAAAIVVALLACGDDSGGSSDTGTGTGGATTTSTTAMSTTATSSADSADGADDSVACLPSCEVSVAQCCAGQQPGSGFPSGAGCPSINFPNVYSCDNQDLCDNAGCQPADPDSDEERCFESITGLSCRSVGGVGHCVALCDDTQDCLDHGMPGTVCDELVDSSSQKFCRQPLPT